MDDAPETPRRGRGRPRGAKNKPKPESEHSLTNARLRELAKACYSEKEWQTRFRRLSVAEQFRIRASLEPKQREVPSEPTTQVRLIFRGLQPKGCVCPKCNHSDFIDKFCDSGADIPQHELDDATTPALKEPEEEDIEAGRRTYPTPPPRKGNSGIEG